MPAAKRISNKNGVDDDSDDKRTIAVAATSGARRTASTFYNASFLSDRKTPIGIAWWIGTMGAGSVRLKLKKSDIDSVNIPKTCRTIASTNRPLAIRISANLMMGVVRILSRQSEQVYSDATHTQASIRKAMTDMRQGPNSNSLFVTGTNIDMSESTTNGTSSRSRHSSVGGSSNAVTLADNAPWYVGDFDTILDREWEMHLDRYGTAGGDQESWSSGIGSQSFKTLTSPSGSHQQLQDTQARFTASQEKITLPAYRHLSGETAIEFSPRNSQVEVGRGGVDIGDGLAFDLLGGGDDASSLGGGGGFEFMGDGAGGVFDEDIQLDLGLDDDDGGEFGLGIAQPTRPPTPQQPTSRDVSIGPGAVQLDDALGRADVNDDFSLGMDDQEGVNFEADAPVAINQDQAPTRTPRKRKKPNGKFSRADHRIDLTSQELQNQRPAAYCVAMEEHRAQREANRIALAADRWTKDTNGGIGAMWTYMPSNLLIGSDLIHFWDATVGAEARRVYEATKELKKQIVATRGASTAPQSMRGTMTPNGHIEEYGDGDIPPLDLLDQNGIDVGANDITMVSLEVGRRGSSALPSPSLGAKAMPWDFAGGDVSDLSGSFRGDLTPRSRRSVSVGSLAGGVLPLPASGQTTPRGLTPGDVSRLLTAHQGAAGGGGEESAALESQLQNESQLSKNEGHMDAANLLLYATKTAQEIHPEPLFFSDLAPLSDTSASTTARAFYNLLTLGTSGKIRLSQPQAYGEIEITFADEGKDGQTQRAEKVEVGQQEQAAIDEQRQADTYDASQQGPAVVDVEQGQDADTGGGESTTEDEGETGGSGEEEATSQADSEDDEPGGQQ